MPITGGSFPPLYYEVALIFKISIQGCKKRETTNAIYVTDRQGKTLAMSTPVSGSHNDVCNISEVLSELFSGLNSSALPVSGLFLNTDAGFDTEQFRRRCHEHGEAKRYLQQTPRKARGGKLLDELLYKRRFCIERTNAWINSYRNVLNRFDTPLSSWKAWNYIAFILFLLKKIRMGEKLR